MEFSITEFAMNYKDHFVIKFENIHFHGNAHK